MAKEKILKTNAIRMLEKAKVPYTHRVWEAATGQHTGVELAAALGQNPEQVFKTLVTVAKSGEHYVFLVPVAEELDLKKAAAAVGEKAISMCKSKELGMKKLFRTTIHETAQNFPTILCSAGKIGHQLELSLDSLRQVVPFQLADIIVEK